MKKISLLFYRSHWHFLCLTLCAVLCFPHTKAYGEMLQEEIPHIVERIIHFTMKNDEQEPPKIYVIDKGDRDGFKKNSIYIVRRKVNFINPMDGAYNGDIDIHLGTIKIIEISELTSLAVPKSLEINDVTKNLQYPEFMIGDELVVEKANEEAQSTFSPVPLMPSMPAAPQTTSPL